jgi:hypothetical protein
MFNFRLFLRFFSLLCHSFNRYFCFKRIHFDDKTIKFISFFYILLTVHRGITFVNNQLDVQFFFHLCLFLFSTCFGQPCAHHQENYLYQYDIWYMSLYIDDCLFVYCVVMDKTHPNLYTKQSSI